LEKFYTFIEDLNSFVWGYPVVITVFCLHIYITYKTGFIQRKLFKGIKLFLQNKSYSKGQISPFAALCVDLSGTVAMGNILGVFYGIVLGGTGSVFWIFVAGILSVATKYAESLLVVKYKVKNQDETIFGGMMYVIEHALKKKWLAVLYAIFFCISSITLYDAFQASEIITLCKRYDYPLSTTIIAILIAVTLACCIFKGIKSISKICVVVVPFMIILYVLSCLAILVINIKYLFPAIILIIKQAFSLKAGVGGSVGIGVITAMRYGISKSAFSSEAGFGTNSVSDALAKAKSPFQQALISSTGTFWDTCVCVLTGLIIATTLCTHPKLPFNEMNITLFLDLTFSKVPFGSLILFCCLFLFIFSTMLEGAYIFETSIKYLLSKINPFFIRSFFVFAIIFVVIIPDRLWTIAIIFEVFVMVPSLLTLFLLGTMISRETKQYFSNDKIDENVDFIPFDKNGNQNKMRINL
jgi:AGCS family alanine or glycine:cation symporter